MITLFYGAPEEIRTPGRLLRRQLLYPTELLAREGFLTHAGSGGQVASSRKCIAKSIFKGLPSSPCTVY